MSKPSTPEISIRFVTVRGTIACIQTVLEWELKRSRLLFGQQAQAVLQIEAPDRADPYKLRATVNFVPPCEVLDVHLIV